MKSIMDNLTKALDLSPLDAEVIDTETGEITTTESTDIVLDTVDDADLDFEEARKNLKALAKKGNKALDDLLMLARSSEHPRAYEVVATVIKTLSDTNKDLLDIRKKRVDIKGGVPEGKPVPGKTVNNLFVGTTAELQKFLRDRDKVIDDVPPAE